MRKFFWQRWALLFVLVSRLVIGEWGHAMPSADSAAVGAAHPSAELPCDVTHPAADAEHNAGSQQPPSSHHGGHSAHASGHPSDESSSSSGEQDCCKSGECECPCLHAPCAALDAHVLNPIATTLLRTPHGAEGLVSQRPSGVFRPPA